MLRMKHVWVDGNDLIVALACFRTSKTWCQAWTKNLGPCYGAMVIKDAFAGVKGESGIDSGPFKDGYVDHRYLIYPYPHQKSQGNRGVQF